MKLQNKKIKVHPFFVELFGKETTKMDLLAITFSSVLFAAITLLLKWDGDLSILKKTLLTILALDIGGGVVANFSEGTNNYYAKSISKRYFFILFHLLQPSILIWIFPNDIFPVTLTTIYTLTSSIIVLNVKDQYTQRITAVTLLISCLLLTPFLNYSDVLLQLTMFFYSIKLILAFSVDWTLIDEK
ncbi:MAG: hypothetical protein EBS86_14250 [Crocinitomicaceae bacterium]|nr:hypothetical protein [Crocinitomicaceae bacterium]